MNTQKVDWEKWFYRVVIVVGAIAWVVASYPDETSRWWRHAGHLVVPLSVPFVTLVWLVSRRPRWTKALGWVAAAWLWAVIVFPVFAPDPGHRRQSSCPSNLKQIAIASLQYASDYDGRLPSMEVHWTAALDPYVKNRRVFHCLGDPNHPHQLAAGEDEQLTYALNPYLRGRKVSDIDEKILAQVILAWCGDEAGPALQYDGRFNVAFADGGVRRLLPDVDPGIWNPWEPPEETTP